MDDDKRLVWLLTHPRLPGAVTILEDGNPCISHIPEGSILTRSKLYKNVWDLINDARYGIT